MSSQIDPRLNETEMTLSLLQWNIWYKEDIRSIVQFLREHPADVICLQELTTQDIPEIGHTPDYIAEQLGYEYYYEIADLGPDTIPVGNGIFSKFPIVSSRTVWINQTEGSGGYDDQPRAYIEATLQVGNQRLTVGTTHMSYTKAFVSTPRKEQEADKLVQALQASKGNFIFTGDLNAEPDSPTTQKIKSALKHVGPDLQEPT